MVSVKALLKKYKLEQDYHQQMRLVHHSLYQWIMESYGKDRQLSPEVALGGKQI